MAGISSVRFALASVLFSWNFHLYAVESVTPDKINSASSNDNSPDSKLVSSSQCIQEGHSPSGEFMSPGYPGNTSHTFQECWWEIEGSHDDRVTLTFLDVNLPGVDSSTGRCRDAFMTWGGFDPLRRRVVEGRVCGNTIPDIFTSVSSRVWVSLTLTGVANQSVYQSCRGLMFKYEISYSNLRLNHLTVGIVLGVMVPLVCCSPMVWYYKRKKRQKANNTIQRIATEKYFRQKMVKKIIDHSQHVLSASAVDLRSKLYGVSAYMRSDDGTSFESIEAARRMQATLLAYNKRRKLETMLSVIESKDGRNGSHFQMDTTRNRQVDPRCQIYEVKHEDLSFMESGIMLASSTPYSNVMKRATATSELPKLSFSDENRNCLYRNRNIDDEYDADESVLGNESGRKVSFQPVGKRPFSRRKMSLASSAPSLGSISELEEFAGGPGNMRHAESDVAGGDTSRGTWKGNDSVFTRREPAKSVRFSESGPLYLGSEGELSDSVEEEEEDGEEEEEVGSGKGTRLGGEEDSWDDIPFFDAQSNIEQSTQGQEESVDVPTGSLASPTQCMEESVDVPTTGSLSSPPSPAELTSGSESGSNEVAII